MGIVRWIYIGFFILLIVIFGAGFSWTHGFVVWMVASADCPQKLVLQARRDVKSLFGEARAKPLWVCAKKPLLGLDVSHGTTRMMPFLPSVIVIGKKGPNRNVMAHEYAHAELAARIGIRINMLPTWFEEGLAMQVDHRRAYSRRSLARYLKRARGSGGHLDQITTPARFYKRDKARLNYALARCVVGLWMQANKGHQPDKLIRHLNDNKRFPHDEFRRFERRCQKI